MICVRNKFICTVFFFTSLFFTYAVLSLFNTFQPRRMSAPYFWWRIERGKLDWQLFYTLDVCVLYRTLINGPRNSVGDF